MHRTKINEFDIRDVVDAHLVVKEMMELVELANPHKERIVVVIYKEEVHQLENYR